MIKPCLCVSACKRDMGEAAKQAFGMLDNTKQMPGSCILCLIFFFLRVFGREDTVKNVHNWVLAGLVSAIKVCVCVCVQHGLCPPVNTNTTCILKIFI